MVLCRSSLCSRATEPHSFGLSLSKPGRSPSVLAELVEAGACWLRKHARVEGGGRESPGMRVTFFCFAKRKSPKKRRPPVCDPFAVRRGKPASGRLRGAPWNSLCAGARRSDNHGESDYEACALRRACSPRNRPAAGAASRGGTAEQPNSPHGPLLRSASRSRRAAPAPAPSRPSAAMARGVVRLRVPFCACREAQGRGCVRVPKDTRTSCTDSPQLSERSAQRAVSSAAHPLTEHRRLPVAQRRDTHSRVAFSLVTFSWRDKRKLLRRRAHTPAPALKPGMRLIQHPSPGFDKLSPNGQWKLSKT